MGEFNMKALSYIAALSLLILSSCTSRLYTGAEYDDLYYLPSDRPAISEKAPAKRQITEENLKSGDNYYNNIYAADTLISDRYSDSLNYNDQNINGYNNYDQGYDNSYESRLRRFNGNYFDPYYSDPYYSGFGYPYYGSGFGMGMGMGMGMGLGYGFGYGYGGYPYYNPYMGYGGFYGDYYGGLYGGYYGGYYGMGGYYVGDARRSVNYGRSERPSTLSSRWNRSTISPTGTSRRDSYSSSGIN